MKRLIHLFSPCLACTFFLIRSGLWKVYGVGQNPQSLNIEMLLSDGELGSGYNLHVSTTISAMRSKFPTTTPESGVHAVDIPEGCC